jgi:hypothetical protein
MRRFFEILNREYPFNDDLKSNAKMILFITIGITVFHFVFQPLGTYSFSTGNLFLFVGGLALITFSVLSVNLLILPGLLPRIFNSEKWNIKKEILWNLWILASIAGGDFLYFSILLGMISMTFSDIIKMIFIIALPVALLIVINRTRLLKLHLKTARDINRRLLKNEPESEEKIVFTSEYKEEDSPAIRKIYY